MRRSDLYQLYINALDRLRPDAMAGWLIASNLYGAIILGSVLMGIFNNVQLNNTTMAHHRNSSNSVLYNTNSSNDIFL